MNAIHFTCDRDVNGGLSNLTYDKESGTYRSGFWNITVDQAESLVGGWVYLHQTKATTSQFGGKILSFEQVTVDGPAPAERIVFVLTPSHDGRGQKWRGKQRAWTGGVVEASLPHEQAVPVAA